MVAAMQTQGSARVEDIGFRSQDMPRPLSAGTRAAGYTLAMLVGIYAVSFVDRNILYVVAPSIQSDLHLSDTELGLLSGLAFALFYATMALPIARVAERRSRVGLIAIALVLWSLMTGLSGAATRFWHLFVARLGVGVGEGACSPCAQSIICDLYPPERRATALSIYAIGVPLGVMIGGIGGAIASKLFGWRGAFIAAAIPGLLLALLLYMTVREPVRGACEPGSYVDRAVPPFIDVVRALWRSPIFRHTALGYAVGAIPATAIQIFFVVFLVRVYGMAQLDAGIAFGLIAGITGAIGMFFGGRVADLFGARDIRSYGFVPAVAFLCLPPLLIAALTRESVIALAAFMVIPAILYVFNIGASYAVTNNLVEPRMRATTNAILLMVITLFGSGLGPALVGWASDRLAAWSFGADYLTLCMGTESVGTLHQRCAAAAADGLRYALVLSSLLYLWAAAHYFRLALLLNGELGPTKNPRG
jgi:predicted MFS family arabinose efflux permease